jgi:plasmid stability protein
MTVIEIPDEEAAALRAKAAAEGLTLEAWFRKLAREGIADGARRSGRHIGERIQERMRNVPPEAREAMPRDGASQHDHYIYGLPKNEE